MSVRVWVYDPDPEAVETTAPYEFVEVPRSGEWVIIEGTVYVVRSLTWRGSVRRRDDRHGDALEPYIRLVGAVGMEEK